MARSKEPSPDIDALRVKQWVPAWDAIRWNPKERRAEPLNWFYQFSMPAATLKALSGIYARSTTNRSRGSEDLGIQRRHEKERSSEIARFVQFGFPWSELSKAKQQSQEFHDLRKPGWLPTAIVINILKASDMRHGKHVAQSDLVCIEDDPDGRRARLRLPSNFTTSTWKPSAVPPVEVIDGQHRLWAFEGAAIASDFELPVVAFYGLDLSWQAYLFYTINIKPKRINASLAFDLYPLLRTEDWLNKFEGHIVYREARAQELVDLLWSHPESPWHRKINMLGEAGLRGSMVSQSAWVRSLLASYVKSWEGRGVRLGGLFGAPVGSQALTLPWSRAEQAAFLICFGNVFKDAVKSTNAKWAIALRRDPAMTSLFDDGDLAFFGPRTLLNQDQGIRAFLHVSNDMMFIVSDELELERWGLREDNGGDESDRVRRAIALLKKNRAIYSFMHEICARLSIYDWRASGAPGLTKDEALLKAAFRGSGGYKELRKHVLEHLTGATGKVGSTAKRVLAVID